MKKVKFTIDTARQILSNANDKNQSINDAFLTIFKGYGYLGYDIAKEYLCMFRTSSMANITPSGKFEINYILTEHQKQNILSTANKIIALKPSLASDQGKDA